MCDLNIIESILSGNPEKFRTLVKKYQETVFRTAMGFLHCREEAEDACQETFICAYRSLRNFRKDAEFSTWLYRITVNCCLNHLAKLRKRNFLERAEDIPQQVLHIHSEEKNLEECLTEKQAFAIVRKAIDELPEKQRTAFVLSKYDELPQKEIARIMNTSEGAIEQLLQRAKINLQKKLKQA